jgi:hypothetical protein
MRTVRARIAIAAALFAVLAGPLAAAAEPNPHAVLECSYCHFDTPRFGVDTRDTVNFWRAEGDEPHLCERCHGPEENFHPLGVVPGPEHLGTRRPEHLPLGKTEAVNGQVVCTTCHFVHAATGDWALLRGFPGSEQPGVFSTWQELCRECHGAGLEKRSPHGGDERSCAFCHSAKPTAGRPPAVTPAGRKLCEFCHGRMDQRHYAGVSPYREPKDCVDCHNPHLGKEHPARLKAGYFDPIRDAATLNPHRRRTLCFACHPDGKTGALRGADAVALCQRCHGSGEIPGMSHPMVKVPPGYAIPEGWPLADGKLTCLTCHFPGHSRGAVGGRPGEPTDVPHLLRGGVAKDRVAVCFRCHSREQWAGRDPHRDAGEKQTGCALCHVGEPDAARFVADVNILCLACHSSGDHPAGAVHTVTLEPGMPEVSPRLPLGTGRRITCATCHDPHVDPPSGYRLRGAGEPLSFCIQCHKL